VGHDPLPFRACYHENPAPLLQHFDRGDDVEKPSAPPTPKNPGRILHDRLGLERIPGEQCYCGKPRLRRDLDLGHALQRNTRASRAKTCRPTTSSPTQERRAKAVAALDRYTDRLARALAGTSTPSTRTSSSSAAA